jgi:hypothetical protein
MYVPNAMLQIISYKSNCITLNQLINAITSLLKQKAESSAANLIRWCFNTLDMYFTTYSWNIKVIGFTS